MSDYQPSSSSPNLEEMGLDAYHTAFTSRYPYDPAAMEIAFEQARNALVVGEAAIGCVFIDVGTTTNTNTSSPSLTTSSSTSQLKYGRVAAVGHNLTNAEHNALAHAEFVAIRSILETSNHHHPDQSEKAVGEIEIGGRQPEVVAVRPPGPYVLYVTVEPCIMCGSMLAQSGMVAGVYFGCSNPRFGGNGTVLSVHRSLTPIQIPTQASSQSSSSSKCTYECFYASIGGYRAEEAVGLLQNFYSSENPAAPDERRKRKPNQDGTTTSE